jgi:hypothetical protein
VITTMSLIVCPEQPVTGKRPRLDTGGWRDGVESVRAFCCAAAA